MAELRSHCIIARSTIDCFKGTQLQESKGRNGCCNGVLAIARDLYTYRYFNSQEKTPRYRGVYSSFAAAESAIPKGRPEGFDLEAVPDFFIGKAVAFQPE